MIWQGVEVTIGLGYYDTYDKKTFESNTVQHGAQGKATGVGKVWWTQ